MRNQVVKSVLMSSEEWATLQTIANNRGRQSVASVIRQAVQQYIQQEAGNLPKNSTSGGLVSQDRPAAAQ